GAGKGTYRDLRTQCQQKPERRYGPGPDAQLCHTPGDPCSAGRRPVCDTAAHLAPARISARVFVDIVNKNPSGDTGRGQMRSCVTHRATAGTAWIARCVTQLRIWPRPVSPLGLLLTLCPKITIRPFPRS